MFNLSGIFFDREPDIVYEGKTFYGFSLVCPDQNKLFYLSSLTELEDFEKAFKQANHSAKMSDKYEMNAIK